MKRFRYPHIMERVTLRPLMITPQKAEIIFRVLMERAELAHAEAGKIFLLDDEEKAVMLGRAGRVDREGYDVIDGIAVIPVGGTLVHKHGSVRASSGLLGYDSIRLNFRAALDDQDVEGIFLDLDSPGGEVSGCFDLVDAMYEARGVKPVWAHLDETACSAAYNIASTADTISLPRTGFAGSIGVICMHTDISAALDDAGIKPTFIQFGARKNDGASELPLSKEALAIFQQQVDVVGELFVNTVARNRNLDADDVRKQEAGIFQGREAVKAGLADFVMSKDEAFGTFHQSIFSP